jgi:hypothetical protein
MKATITREASKPGPRLALVVCCLSVVIPGLSSPAWADDELARCPVFAGDENHLLSREGSCMSDEELQTLRGGFLLDNRIVIGFGFERIVRIDGEIQEHLLAGLPTLNLAHNIQLVPVSRSIEADSQRFVLQGLDTGGLSSTMLSPGNDATAGLATQIQLIPSTAALQEMMNNVIQNSFDDRTIEQMRVINIDLMGLGEAPRFDPQRDLNPALFESLGL